MDKKTKKCKIPRRLFLMCLKEKRISEHCRATLRAYEKCMRAPRGLYRGGF